MQQYWSMAQTHFSHLQPPQPGVFLTSHPVHLPQSAGQVPQSSIPGAHTLSPHLGLHLPQSLAQVTQDSPSCG